MENRKLYKRPRQSVSLDPSTQDKLKGLLVPQEQEGGLRAIVLSQARHPFFTGFSFIGHLDHESELDLKMKLNLDEHASLSATSAHVATSNHCTLSVPMT